MARGEEALFDLEDLLRRYGSSPPNPEVPAPPSSSRPARNPSEHSVFPRKDGLKPLCCMFVFGMFVLVFECNLCMCC